MPSASIVSATSSRSGDIGKVSDVRLLWTIVFNQLLTVGEVIAGILSGSVSLLSDAAHNFNDANALLITYVARRIANRKPNEEFTFGYRRAELIGAVINLTLLAVIGLFLVYEATVRLFQPVEILGWLMATAAVLALVVDVITALLLWRMKHGSLNVRAAFLHNAVDAVGSIAVLIGAVAIALFDWTWVDPLITYAIAGYVLWQVWVMLPKAARVLMEGTPSDLDPRQITLTLRGLSDVLGVHHIHLWELDENHRALEAHVVISQCSAKQQTMLKEEIKRLLTQDFQIGHATIEFDFEGRDRCDTALIAEH